MENITTILQELEQGKISADNAEDRVLRLFSVSGQLPLSTEQQRFIEWISLYDEWHWSSVRKQWEKEHYRSRTTQELFEYYFKRKTQSGNFR